jgi:hypothetical protein
MLTVDARIEHLADDDDRDPGGRGVAVGGFLAWSVACAEILHL